MRALQLVLILALLFSFGACVAREGLDANPQASGGEQRGAAEVGPLEHLSVTSMGWYSPIGESQQAKVDSFWIFSTVHGGKVLHEQRGVGREGGYELWFEVDKLYRPIRGNFQEWSRGGVCSTSFSVREQDVIVSIVNPRGEGARFKFNKPEGLLVHVPGLVGAGWIALAAKEEDRPKPLLRFGYCDSGENGRPTGIATLHLLNQQRISHQVADRQWHAWRVRVDVREPAALGGEYSREMLWVDDLSGLLLEHYSEQGESSRLSEVIFLGR